MAANREEKISFVLYGSYAEQVNMLTNEQAGELFKSIFVYADTGEKQCKDPMAALMLSVIGHQMDIDAQKYAESKERRINAGKKGGRPRKNTDIADTETVEDTISGAPLEMTQNDKPEKAMVFSEKHAKDVKPVYVDEDVYVDVDDDVYVDEDVDVLNKISGGGGEEEEEHARARVEPIIRIFDDCYATTRTEAEKFERLAEELLKRYAHKQPSVYDLQQVFERSYDVKEVGEETYIAVYDMDKAELLRYAFQKAAEADKVNWGYITGIYSNFNRRGITCVEDAYKDNWERNYGVISA